MYISGKIRKIIFLIKFTWWIICANNQQLETLTNYTFFIWKTRKTLFVEKQVSRPNTNGKMELNSSLWERALFYYTVCNYHVKLGNYFIRKKLIFHVFIAIVKRNCSGNFSVKIEELTSILVYWFADLYVKLANSMFFTEKCQEKMKNARHENNNFSCIVM